MGILIYFITTNTKWQSDTEKEVKVLERVSARSPPRDTQERSTSHSWKELPSQPSEDWPEEVVSREFHSSSTTTPEISSRDSWAVLSETLLLILNTPRERLLPLWMSFMLLKDKAEPFTVSVHKSNSLSLFYNNLVFLFVTSQQFF